MTQFTNETIKDDVYVEIDDEFEQIRTALGMYISKLGLDGARHLIKELFNNYVDEAVNPEALSKTFDFIFDEVEQSVTLVDYSRGIPFEKLVDVCTKKHTSTKFERNKSMMKEQAGRNGVGLVVTAACSKYFSMTSYRGDMEKTVSFVNGEMKEEKPKKLKKMQHGLMVKFIPSSEYLKGEVNLEPYMIQDYLRTMAYIIRDDIGINYYEFAKDMPDSDYQKKKPSTKIKYRRLGLSENVKYLSQSLEFNPIEIFSETDDFDLEVAFSYDKTIDEMIINSYCNYINTTEGGYHETVAMRAICDFLCREAKNLDPKSKYEVTFEDCKKGLIFVVNCKHIDPAFEGQHKTRVSNKDVLTNGKQGLVNALRQYFSANNALLRKIISYLRTISKIRMEAHKIKGLPQKKVITFTDEHDIPMYYPLANRNYNGYTELIIAEGDSAAVAIDTARNNKYQAVFGVMGVVGNTYGMTTTQVIQKYPVFRNLLTVIGCGFGKDFNLAKLRFSKIIIEADADADGSNITSLILLFFVAHLPQLVLEGKIYKALPPLLILNDSISKRWWKGSLYVYSRQEYYEVINRIVSNNVEIALEDNNGVSPLKKKEAYKWLQMNSEYTSELAKLQDRSFCDPLVLEYICYAMLLSLDNQAKFKKILEKRYPEMIYDISLEQFSGSNEGNDLFLVLDHIFWKNAKKFMKILASNETMYVYAKNANSETDKYTKYTIGEFLFNMEKSFPVKIDQRYKGIGEMEATVIFATTLNPKIRRLIRFNMTNIEETNDIFKLLHEKSDKMRQMRRDLIDKSDISYMDLDN